MCINYFWYFFQIAFLLLQTERELELVTRLLAALVAWQTERVQLVARVLKLSLQMFLLYFDVCLFVRFFLYYLFTCLIEAKCSWKSLRR